MKIRYLIILAILFFSGCSIEKNVSEAEVMTLLTNYFKGIDVDNVHSDLFESMVTDDYYIFEAGKVMSVNELKTFVKGIYKSTKTISSDWKFSDIKINTDKNSAHITYINDGTFISEDGKALKLKWFETGYMIKTPDGLKMQCMSSTEIKTIE